MNKKIKGITGVGGDRVNEFLALWSKISKISKHSQKPRKKTNAINQ